jgi:dihydrodipicolinate synthase/N-acetylneuraminate lyase
MAVFSIRTARDEKAQRMALANGTVIPAHPLALNASRRLDERRQRALSRYYIAAGAGGLAVGVHTTQFLIHDATVGLYEPVLSLAAEEMDRADSMREVPLVRVAGICGSTAQAASEAALARELGYSYGLINLAALRGRSLEHLINHCRRISEIIGVFGFYLQPKVGGIELPLEFWRAFCEIENVAAIKVAAFDRYRTLEVVRAVIEAGREDIALYTGNDDNIVFDLLTPFTFFSNGRRVSRYFVGGLLGQWAIWTSKAVALHAACREIRLRGKSITHELLALANELTIANAAVFDAANGFRGCIPGINEVLRRQGLLESNLCLDKSLTLSPGQDKELEEIVRAYPHLVDDEFVDENRSSWLDD